MVVASLIERKRDGGALTAGEWAALIEAFAADRVPRYQMAAMLMAILWRGLAPAELQAMTDAMLNSGARLDFSGLDRPVVDKHSTGGVGDKTSLILAPLVACCGVAVPMMSGRGLGHTGGTVDKLESIPGFRTGLSLDETRAQVERIGVAMLSQTPEIAPADRKLYALRDVTATVESIPLICASIMSKKLAEGLGGLVLDVKTGSGAFLPSIDDGLELARTMIRVGEGHGCRTVALLTAMDRPLGRAMGHALEIEESLQALEGKGPDDLVTVTMALAVEMLLMAGVADTAVRAREQLDRAIESGQALARFREVIEAQGGDAAIVDDPSRLPQAGAVELFHAPEDGIVQTVLPRVLGRAIIALGGGREEVGDAIDPAVGFVVTVKPGDRVRRGQPVGSVFAADQAGITLGQDALAEAIRVGPNMPHDVRPLVSHRVSPGGVEELA